jgi:hypothetical protein
VFGFLFKKSPQTIKPKPIPRGRDALIRQATLAAADPLSPELLLLFVMLETETDQDVINVGYFPRKHIKNNTPEVLLTLSWDGNEWRRVFVLDTFVQELEEVLGRSPELSSQKMRDMLDRLKESMVR